MCINKKRKNDVSLHAKSVSANAHLHGVVRRYMLALLFDDEKLKE